jgi:methylated-DNA-[protein]-cysteine S-methyltransferase
MAGSDHGDSLVRYPSDTAANRRRSPRFTDPAREPLFRRVELGWRIEESEGMQTTTTTPSPIGELTLTNTDGVLSGLRMGGGPSGGKLGARTSEGFEQVVEELAEYFVGERTEFTVPSSGHGDAFQRRVWALLRTIPFGQTRSYGDLARELGDPALAREVGAANARNPIGIIVPCHRVIGSDGSLTGYAGGLERKRYLLDHERGVAQLF